jgi:PIN domain nuclease of toxin-antitoxin system
MAAEEVISCQPMWMPLSVKLWINTLEGCLHLSCSTADAPVARQPVDLNKKTSTFLALGVPLVHHDPVDRLLIAQSRVEGLMAVSSDGHWPGYIATTAQIQALPAAEAGP